MNTRYLSLFIIISLSLSSCALADLRTEELKQQGITEEAEKKGRQLLEEAWKAQGMNNLHEFSTYEVKAKDHWKGIIGKTGNPWPVNNELMRLQYKVGTFDSELTVLEGKKTGFHAGLQSWKYYEYEQGESPSFDVKRDKALSFILPAYQYFFELADRLKSVPIVAHMGATTFNGQNYDLVFASWETAEPHKEHDQYVLYINQETKLIDYASYTLRDNYVPSPKGLYGSIQFKAMTDVQGVKIPFEQIVYAKAPKRNEKKYLHRLEVQSFLFDAFNDNEIFHDSQLKPMGDKKVEN